MEALSLFAVSPLRGDRGMPNVRDDENQEMFVRTLGGGGREAGFWKRVAKIKVRGEGWNVDRLWGTR